MSDKPTKKPVLATSSEPKPPMASGKIVKPEMGITIMPMPAKPKVSIENDNASLETKFNRGAVKPWKPKGGRASSRGSSDVKMKPVSKKMGDASMGISLKTGYKKIG